MSLVTLRADLNENKSNLIFILIVMLLISLAIFIHSDFQKAPWYFVPVVSFFYFTNTLLDYIFKVINKKIRSLKK